MISFSILSKLGYFHYAEQVAAVLEDRSDSLPRILCDRQNEDRLIICCKWNVGRYALEDE